MRALLTPRELQVLAAAARGLSCRQIAEELGTAEPTVKTQTETLRRKLGVRSMAHAVAVGLRMGLIPDAEPCPWGHRGSCDCIEASFTCAGCGATNHVKAPARCLVCGAVHGLAVRAGGAA